MSIKIIDETVMSYFDFDFFGNLYWKRVNEYCRNGKVVVGGLAGCLSKSTGCYVVGINGKSYVTHRILYQFYHNVILKETDVIDHIDRDRTNNIKENLRLDPNTQNQCNRTVGKNNKSTGIKNITILHRDGYDEYLMLIRKNKKRVFSKLFPITTSREDLIKIRDEQLKIHHGEFACFD